MDPYNGYVLTSSCYRHVLGFLQYNHRPYMFPEIFVFLKKHWGTAITRVSKRLPTEEDGKTVITVKRVYQGLSYVSQLDDLSI